MGARWCSGKRVVKLRVLNFARFSFAREFRDFFFLFAKRRAKISTNKIVPHHVRRIVFRFNADRSFLLSHLLLEL